MAFSKNIHLLYVPTIYCNLGCRYCYLGELTDTGKLKQDNERAVSTLDFAVKKFLDADIQPFNVSLHGGEVSTLNQETLGSLFGFITGYYEKYKTDLDALGFNKRDPHVKTNLYNFDKQYDLFVENKVSVSASIDLPLSQHDTYRRTKSDTSTLSKTIENLKLLSKYPHRKKFSSTIYHTHFEKIDELIKDIWYIHKEVGYDMNYYNFMFGFEAEFCNEKFEGEMLQELKPLTEDQQVEFYERMKKEFMGTELEMGLQKYWFEEFTPDFCTSSPNCGEKFFLLQSDGEIYSCVRGQGVKEFHYGNIFKDDVQTVLSNAKNSIKAIINKAGMHEDCRKCEYLYICNTGCPFVKVQQKESKSYTCLLQKAIYRDRPAEYPPIRFPEEKRAALYDYMHKNHPQRLFDAFDIHHPVGVNLPSDMDDDKNTLVALIRNDEILQELYSSGNFSLWIDNKTYVLESQLLKQKRQIIMISIYSNVFLRVKKDLFTVNCKEPVRNTLYLQMLRDTKVIYGDDKREKQEHTFTNMVYYNSLLTSEENTETHFVYDLMPLFRAFQGTFKEKVVNNLFVTTGALRDYHYQKQKENGFYHIQAINLPFQNIEFFWIEDEDY